MHHVKIYIQNALVCLLIWFFTSNSQRAAKVSIYYAHKVRKWNTQHCGFSAGAQVKNLFSKLPVGALWYSKSATSPSASFKKAATHNLHADRMD